MSRGALCVKCSAGYNNEWLDPAVRLTRPLRRVGPKGSGHFAPISWDEAIGTIADRLRRIDADSGAHTIINAHYSGTLSLLAYFFPMRFFHRLGATEVVPDSICNLAGHVALAYVYGTSFEGFDPRTVRDAACIVVWGANPAASAPHAFEHWFRPAPGTKIVVDPIRTETAKAADLHLQPFPGSDAALAFALLHVLRRDGLIDRDFIARHTVGWDELEPLLDDCTPAWGETTTGVPAELIEQAARLYGPGPSLLWLGQGLQRQPTGGNVMRACSLLPAATGNLGKPGAGLPVPELVQRPGDRRGLPDRRAPEPGCAADQPHGPGRLPRRPGALPGAHLLEHERRRLGSAPAAVAPGAAARGPVHGRARPVPDRYGRLRRHRAAGGELPGVRRPVHPLFPVDALGPGQGGRAAGRIAAQPGDLPPAGPRHGLHRAGAVRA